MEKISRHVGGYDISYDEVKESCSKCWEGDFIYLYIDRFKNKIERRYCVSNERKDTYIDCTPATKAFWLTLVLYGLYNENDLEKLNELASLKNQVEELGLQDQMGKQNFHDDMKKLVEPNTDIVEDVSTDLKKPLTETSKMGYKPVSNLKENVLKLVMDQGIMASYLLSLLINLVKNEKKAILNY